MLIGSCWIEIRIPGVRSLKEKRRVVKSLKEQIRNRFNVSVAEVGALDSWQRAEIGICCVSNSRARSDQMLAKVVDKIHRDPRLQLIDYQTEVF